MFYTTTINTLLTAVGMNLLGSAVTEAQDPGNDNQAFARQLYIHAMGYLLQGLPQNLSEAEAKTLQASIPSSLQIDDTRRDGKASSETTGSPPPPSLHTTSALSLGHCSALHLPLLHHPIHQNMHQSRLQIRKKSSDIGESLRGRRGYHEPSRPEKFRDRWDGNANWKWKDRCSNGWHLCLVD